MEPPIPDPETDPVEDATILATYALYVTVRGPRSADVPTIKEITGQLESAFNDSAEDGVKANITGTRTDT